MTNRTSEQANIVGDAAVASANDVGQKTVEGVENVAAVNPVSDYYFKATCFSSLPADASLSHDKRKPV